MILRCIQQVTCKGNESATKRESNDEADWEVGTLKIRHVIILPFKLFGETSYSNVLYP